MFRFGSLATTVVRCAIVCWLVSSDWQAGAAEATNSHGADGFRLPAEFIEEEGIFILHAQIGGEGPLNLLLDTGASDLFISEQVAARLRKSGKLRRGRRIAVGSSSGRTRNLMLVEVANVQCGELSLKSSMAIVGDLSAPGAVIGKRLDGIAGIGLFKSGTLVLDYPAGEVWFESAAKRGTNWAQMLPFNFREAIPRLELDWGGERFMANIDSGAMRGFTVPLAVTNLSMTGPPVTVGTYLNLTESGDDRASRLATNVIFGGITFERPAVHWLAGNFGLIGVQVLRQFTVSLDMRNNQVWLKPATNGPVPGLPIRSAGFTLYPSTDRGNLRVRTILAKSEAARSGIGHGSLLSAINGEPAANWTSKRWRELIEQADEIQVDLVQGKKTKRVNLKVKTLVE
jgi:hypothetical protein